MFEVILVSDAFIGMPLLKRHRLVNDVVNYMTKNERKYLINKTIKQGKDVISRIHAFSQKCYTEQQWNERKEKEAIE